MQISGAAGTYGGWFAAARQAQPRLYFIHCKEGGTVWMKRCLRSDAAAQQRWCHSCNLTMGDWWLSRWMHNHKLQLSDTTEGHQRPPGMVWAGQRGVCTAEPSVETKLLWLHSSGGYRETAHAYWKLGGFLALQISGRTKLWLTFSLLECRS